MNPLESIDLKPGLIPHCQVCRSKARELILDLGHNALCDSPLSPSQLDEPETVYPLRLVRCSDCGLVQIDYSVDPTLLFHPEYPYLSGITDTLRKSLHSTAEVCAQKFSLPRGGFVVDIGSNDGTLLEGFATLGMKVLGIEATNIAEIANKRGIHTVQTFFNLGVAEKILSAEGPARLVTATNIFAHVNHLGTFLQGVHALLGNEGVFVSESHYLLDIVTTLQYDSIYHEHLRYYSIKPLIRLFDSQGFTLIDVEQISNYGGSIRVYAKKHRGHPVSPRVQELIEEEERAGLYRSETYRKFAEQVKANRGELRSLLINLYDAKNSVVGIGCPGRAATLLTYCGISRDLLPYIAEQPTSLKVGKFTPGTHIPIVEESRMLEEQPEYALLLSWHYAKDIAKKLREKGLRSKIIVPLPRVMIVSGEL